MEQRIKRFFNTAGPIRADRNYFIDPLSRVDLDEILSLIDQEKYFVLHAPRQTGKTSYLRALTDYLNRAGQYKCLYSNIERAQAARENVHEGMKAILGAMASDALQRLKDPFMEDHWEAILEKMGPFSALESTLSSWCIDSKKPVVLLLDEVDALVGDTLISLLRQLRGSYDKRPEMFPQSVILCGVRDIRDYRIHSDAGKSIITGGSAFNIKAKSFKLGDFRIDEIKELYRQHTRDTGQEFEDDVFPLVWGMSEGQPWLVNALAYEVCFEMQGGRNRADVITADMVRRAGENLILRRETHLDQLADKLLEDRVRRVIAPILSGAEAVKIPVDDIDYAVDLGLVKKEGRLRIANSLYREIIRKLTYNQEIE